MNRLDGEPSVDLGDKGFMYDDVGLRHHIHQTVVGSIYILPSFDVFPYGIKL